MEFLNWLQKEKQISERSAKDVISRCKRISKLSNDTAIDNIDYDSFINSEAFLSQSMFIKSQLKRAFNLYREFKAHK